MTRAYSLAVNVWTTRRGVGVVIAMLVIGIAVVLYSLATGTTQVVRYGSAIIAPEQASYCPGDTLRYHVHVVVDPQNLPSVSKVHEGWYSVDHGVVLRDTVTELTIPIVRPADIHATAIRVVPDVPPGVYYYDHVASNGHAEAYSVGPITVLDGSSCGE